MQKNDNVYTTTSLDQNAFPVSLQPVDPNFYFQAPFNPLLPCVTVDNGMTMVPVRSDGSFGSVTGIATSPNLLKTSSDSSLCSLPTLNTSPFGQAQSPFNLTTPTQQFFTPLVAPHYITTPSVSPQPPMGQPMYSAPSPLLLTPQCSTSSAASVGSESDLPTILVTGSTFMSVPTNFTASRTPERVIPTNISPAASPQMPERTTVQTGFRERMIQQPSNETRTGYPPKPFSSFQRETNDDCPVAGKRQKKYGYRSKQRKIDRTHRSIQEKFMAKGLFAKERELVRGDDTLRIHVKTFEGLTDIQTALNEIENHKEISIRRVAAVFSKKNKFQKKGFIVYLKVDSVSEVETCQTILQRYKKSLRNVAIARAKPSKNETKSATVEPGIEEFVSDLPYVPRRLSATAM
jgi:hypothetical protein